MGRVNCREGAIRIKPQGQKIADKDGCRVIDGQYYCNSVPVLQLEFFHIPYLLFKIVVKLSGKMLNVMKGLRRELLQCADTLRQIGLAGCEIVAV